MSLKFSDIQNFTCGYSVYTANFSVLGLERGKGEPSTAVLALISFLERGNPTKPSTGILSGVENLVDQETLEQAADVGYPLLKPYRAQWRDTVLGAPDGSGNPALNFYEHFLPLAITDFPELGLLFIPEVGFSELLQSLPQDAGISENERVDFYSPLGNVVIEIDGGQHRERVRQWHDEQRNLLLAQYGVDVIRIPTRVLGKGNCELTECLGTIANIFTKRPEFNRLRNFVREAKFSAPNLAFDLQAIPRLQRVIAELLMTGQLVLDSPTWRVGICSDFERMTDWARIALTEVLDLIETYSVLFDERFKRPDVEITYQNLPQGQANLLEIDLSIFEAFHEATSSKSDLIIRNNLKHVLAGKRGGSREAHDLSRPLPRFGSNIKMSGRARKRKETALSNLMYQVFGHADFRKGQLEIIGEIFSNQTCLGLLPTGGGKSLCFQLPALLTSGCVVVVCPITALVRDHTAELKNAGFFRRADYISAEVPTQKRQVILRRLESGHLRFLFVSPEQFQKEEFRDIVSRAVANDLISRFVVDEVHCVSEWGHDFRTSYLTLANTLRRVGPNVPVLCLTATASVNVMQEIQLEFDIDSGSIVYAMDSSRPELHFFVVKSDDKFAELKQLIAARKESDEISTEKPFIVFSQTVNGKTGCAEILPKLRNWLPGQRIGMFSGSKPKDSWSLDIETTYFSEVRSFSATSMKSFDRYKEEVQRLFKEDKISGIVATKAFGMGINKPNVRNTIHFGMPSSIEALYQEAGRAGRDGNEANCISIVSPEQKIPEKIFDPQTPIEDLRAWQEGLRFNGRDFAQQLFFLTSSTRDVEIELDDCLTLLSLLRSKGSSFVEVREFQNALAGRPLEKTLYRLFQLGFVKDWTVEDFRRGYYKVDWRDENVGAKVFHGSGGIIPLRSA
jgi:ATP-dependent DNA helicase RecQ